MNKFQISAIRGELANQRDRKMSNNSLNKPYALVVNADHADFIDAMLEGVPPLTKDACEICEDETLLTETEGLELCFDCRLALGFVTVYKSVPTRTRSTGNYHMNGAQAAPIPPRPR